MNIYMDYEGQSEVSKRRLEGLGTVGGSSLSLWSSIGRVRYTRLLLALRHNFNNNLQ